MICLEAQMMPLPGSGGDGFSGLTGVARWPCLQLLFSHAMA